MFREQSRFFFINCLIPLDRLIIGFNEFFSFKSTKDEVHLKQIFYKILKTTCFLKLFCCNVPTTVNHFVNVTHVMKVHLNEFYSFSKIIS